MTLLDIRIPLQIRTPGLPPSDHFPGQHQRIIRQETSVVELLQKSERDVLRVCQQQTKHIPLTFLEQRSEEHTCELQSPDHLVCRLLLEKKKKPKSNKDRTAHSPI